MVVHVKFSWCEFRLIDRVVSVSTEECGKSR